MNWIKPRKDSLEITCSTMNLEKNKTDSKEWILIRKKVLAKYHNTCMYCGGRYDKYLICIHKDNNKTNNSLDNLDLCCKICYAYTHINMGFHDYFSVYESNKTQLELHRLTIDYYVMNGFLPKAGIIDKSCKLVNISMFEYINWLIKENNNKYKLILNHDFDINFIGIQKCDFDISNKQTYNNHKIEVIKFDYDLYDVAKLSATELPTE